MYDILVVDMVVCDMQVWCGCVLFEVHESSWLLGTVFAIVFMDTVFVCNGMYGQESKFITKK